MKAIQVSYSSLNDKLRAKADGVSSISSLRSNLNNSSPALDIATQLCDKYNWLQNGKFRLEEGGLPNGDTVFVFVKNPQPLLDEIEYILSIDYDHRNLELCRDTVDTLRETYKKYAN